MNMNMNGELFNPHIIHLDVDRQVLKMTTAKETTN